MRKSRSACDVGWRCEAARCAGGRQGAGLNGGLAAAAVLPTPPAAAGSSKTFKSRLQEEVAKRIRPGNADGLPQYATAKNGPDHDPVFEATCSVIVGGVIIRTVGTGKSKKGAEDDAARRALDELGAYTNPIELHFG